MNDAAFFEDTYTLPLAYQERILLRALHEGPKTSHELATLIASRPVDVYSIQLVRVHLSKIRRKLTGSGWEVPVEPGGRKLGGTGIPAVYELRRVENGEQQGA